MLSPEAALELDRELRRAQLAATKLEKVVSTTRNSLEKHQLRLKSFRKRIKGLKGQQRNDLWEQLGRKSRRSSIPRFTFPQRSPARTMLFAMRLRC